MHSRQTTFPYAKHWKLAQGTQLFSENSHSLKFLEENHLVSSRSRAITLEFSVFGTYQFEFFSYARALTESMLVPTAPTSCHIPGLYRVE